MTDYMQYWKKMSRPPISALKTIKGGRLSGMSNISPQWRWQVMTETFGPIGVGWKYTVEKIWTSPGANDEHFAFSSILLYYKTEEGWSDPIPGEGGSMLVAKEAKGMHNNDEAFKMAVTDALGTAMAKIGVGADIYLGTFDGSKYNEPREFPKQINSKESAIKATQQPEAVKSEQKSAPAATVPVDDTQKPSEAPVVENWAVAQAQAEAQGHTGNQILSNIELVKEIVNLSKKTSVEVCKYVGGLEKGKKFTVGQIVNALTGETS